MNTNEIHNLCIPISLCLDYKTTIISNILQKYPLQHQSMCQHCEFMIAECKDNTVMQDTDNNSPELIKWHLNLKQIQLTLQRDKTCLCCSWRAVRADRRHASRVIRYQQEIETQIANCYDILHILCRCRVDCDIVCDHNTRGNSGLLSHIMRVQYLFFSF